MSLTEPTPEEIRQEAELLKYLLEDEIAVYNSVKKVLTRVEELENLGFRSDSDAVSLAKTIMLLLLRLCEARRGY